MPPEEGWVSLDARLERIESALRELIGRERGDQATLGRVEARVEAQGRILWAVVTWLAAVTVYVLTGEVVGWL